MTRVICKKILRMDNMNDKLIDKHSIGMVAALLLATCFAFFCFFYQIINPPCCDADGYIRIAKAYAKFGVSLNEKELDGLRLYGYPLFLSLVIKLAGTLGLQFSFLLFIVQLSLYFLATFLLSQIITQNFSRLVGVVVFYSLLGNVVVYPYLGVALSDGFTTILVVFIVYLILKILVCMFSDVGFTRAAGWLILLGYFVGFAVMVRPASIYLLMPLVVLGCVFIYTQNLNPFSVGLLFVSSVAIGFMLAVTPQLIYNFSSFKTFGFLPVENLGASQFDWGKHVLKYLTNLSGGNPQICYKSPWTVGSPGEGLVWYIQNPIIGFKTVFLHLYGVLDYDYLFPYVYNLENRYRPILFIFSQFVVFWGVAGYFYAVSDLRKIDSTFKCIKSNVTYLLFSLVFPSFLIGWASIHAFSGSEIRWSLPVVAALLPLAAWVVFVRVRAIKQNKLIYGLFFLYLIFAAILSHFLGGLKQFCS